MNQIKSNAPEASVYRKEAGQLLACRGNRLTMILAVLVVAFVIVPYILLDTLYVFFMELLPIWDTWNEFLVYVLLNSGLLILLGLFTWLLVLPLAYGLLYMGATVAREEEIVLADVFHSFSSARTYRRALALAFSVLWRVGIAVGVVLITYNSFVWVSGGNALVLLIGAPIILIEIVTTLILIADRFYIAYFVYAKQAARRIARKQSRRLTRMCRRGAYSYVIDYLLWLLLAFATAGITLIIDTLPRMLISYFLFAEATNERFHQSEDIKDHE